MQYTPTQNLILTALREPIEFPCSSRKEAEQRKFFFLNQKKSWTRSVDEETRSFARYFEAIEVVIRQIGQSSWVCIIRPKGWELKALLASAGLRPDGTRDGSGSFQLPTTTSATTSATTSTTAESPQLSYDAPAPTPIAQVDPTSDEGAHLQLIMEMDDWLDHMSSNGKFPLAEADDLRKKVARKEVVCPTLQRFKDMVQDIAMRKAYKVPTPH